MSCRLGEPVDFVHPAAILPSQFLGKTLLRARHLCFHCATWLRKSVWIRERRGFRGGGCTVVPRYKQPIGTGNLPAYVQFLLIRGYRGVLLFASGSQATLLPGAKSYQQKRNVKYQIELWFTSVSLVSELLSLLIFLIASMHPTRDLLS